MASGSHVWRGNCADLPTAPENRRSAMIAAVPPARPGAAWKTGPNSSAWYAAETALREAAEEIGLAAERVEVLGELHEYVTVTGYRVTPVVGLVTPPLELRLDDFEVAEVFEVPLEFLLDPANHLRNRIVHGGRERHYYAIPYRQYYIWGATAGMLMNLDSFLKN